VELAGLDSDYEIVLSESDEAEVTSPSRLGGSARTPDSILKPKNKTSSLKDQL